MEKVLYLASLFQKSDLKLSLGQTAWHRNLSREELYDTDTNVS